MTGEVSGGTFKALIQSLAQGISVVRMTSLFEQVTGRVPITHLDAESMVASFVDKVRPNNWFYFWKRTLDLTGAVIGLMAVLILLPVIAIVIAVESSGSVLYRQTRLGKQGLPFQIVKFRTMVADAEGDGQPRWAHPDDKRVTRLGRFLRRSRVDEIPQLWNVLKGEMSLVGPRPERPEFISTLEKKIPFYRARLVVKPGITGWAQINFRYGSTVNDAAVKLEYDLYYVKHQSIWLDLLIMARTAGVIIGMAGR
jgi:exopolysaccharide biosynthesis polyprenyl glycosylphosphotransferase